MKNLIETTTGTISSQMILNHCGDYAGRFQDEAFDLLSTVTDLPEFEENQWCDIMFDRDGDVYAIWAEDSLTCYNADAKYNQGEQPFSSRKANQHIFLIRHSLWYF